MGELSQDSFKIPPPHILYGLIKMKTVKPPSLVRFTIGIFEIFRSVQIQENYCRTLSIGRSYDFLCKVSGRFILFTNLIPPKTDADLFTW